MRFKCNTVVYMDALGDSAAGQWQNVWSRVGGHTFTHTQREPQNDLFVSMCDLRLSISANLWGNEACRRVPSEQRLDIMPIPSIQGESVCVCLCLWVGVGGGRWGQHVKAHTNVKKRRKRSRRTPATASEAHQTVWFNVICWLAKASPSIHEMLKRGLLFKPAYFYSFSSLSFHMGCRCLNCARSSRQPFHLLLISLWYSVLH